jgi:hypothetical protein
MEGFLEKNRLLRVVLDALPLPVYVVERECHVVDCNAAGAAFVESSREQLVGRLPGDLLQCIVALAAPGGCGSGAACSSCLLRSTITCAAAAGAPVRRGGVLERKGEQGLQKLHLFVTATPIPATALSLLVIEDVSELLRLRGLVPICAGCKKIRNDKNYWEQVEHYLARQLEMKFTHGMCPECLAAYYPEGSAGPVDPSGRTPSG